VRRGLPLALLLWGCGSGGSGGADPVDAAPDATHVVDAAPDAGPTWGERRVPGRWFAGDLHVHATGASNDTGGDSPPEEIKRVAIERGLDFVVLTDHSNSTGSDPTTRDEDPALFNRGPEFPYWDRAAMLTDDHFLMVDGNEISPVADPPDERGHIGCYPRATLDHPGVVFTDRPVGAVTGGQALAQARAAGCFATVNHAYSPANWINYDWTDLDYDALEVWNGGAAFDPFDRKIVEAWACDLAEGRRVRGVGGSDNHRVHIEPPGTVLDPPLGQPTTWIWAGHLDWPSILGGLEAGRIAVSDTGAPLELDVYDAGRAWLAMTGDEFPAATARWIRVRGHLRDAPAHPRALRLYRVPAGGCHDTRRPGEGNVPESGMTVVAEQPVTTAGPIDVAFPVEAHPGDAWLALVEPPNPSLNEHDVAIADPVFAR
jgi:predicted metal-dependent phosphoesterase TrpH